jgi:outer membrane protein
MKRARIRALLGAVAVLLACAGSPGCAAVRRARAAQDPASAQPGERTPTAAELGLPAAGAVPLADLLQRALRVHPSVVQARHNAEAARSRVREAEAALLPQISTNASVVYRDQQTPSGSTASVSHRFTSFGFDVSWLLFDFGHTHALARNAGEQWLAAQADLRTAEVNAAYTVRNTYFDLARQIELLGVARETVRQFEVHLDQVKEFVRVGTRIPYDETKAEVDLGNARLSEVKARDAMLAAEASLANALGLAEVVDWTPVEGAPLPAIPEGFDGAWALALRSQPSLAAARAREQAASALVDARIAALYPSLDLSFGYSAGGSTFPLPWSWLAGPGARWVPFDGFQNLSTIDEAAASFRAARAARAQAEQQAWLDVRSAWLAIEDARQRLDLTTLTVRNAEQNLDLAQGLFDVGKGTSVELTDSQQALAQARADQVQARADLQAATARLAKALGIAIEER